ncbi:MAG: TonB-dependent receptor [Bacteroidia bacterium]|nr:TonB-dependent receptor [Bacteroidia bacterium]
MRKSIIGIVWFFVINYTFGQNGTIRGKVIDTDSKEALIGVNIIVDNKTGTITDANGKYNLSLKPGDYKITYKYIGYSTNIMEIDIAEGEVRTMDISMKVEVQAIDEIVVSAGKFEQKLSDVTVSLEVIKPARIESMNTTTLDKAINQIPGVDVMAEQPSIRGGSGYSYGAGSRVLILVDDLPILSPSSGDPKWTFMPLENISQIEVLKGASSSLFGSSALNGVINIRTAFPGNKPETKIISSTGIYMNPERQSLVWKKSEPLLFTATNFTHSRKIGNLDIVVGGEVFGDAGYREHEYENHVRLNANVRYRDKKIEGLSYGCNTNYMYLSRGEFFLWVHADSAYRQNPSALSKTDGSRVNIDPFVTYFDKKGDRFSLRTRFYHENYKNLDEAKNNLADMYYGDFQYQKNIKDKFNLTAGISTQYSEVKANLFGNHYSSCIGFYSQVDKKIKKLSLSAGFRFEYCQVDSTQTVSQFELKNKGKMLMEFPIYPVFRTGLNYQLAQYTFLRGSYGQGYRFPSIAEMYTTASIGGLNIFRTIL